MCDFTFSDIKTKTSNMEIDGKSVRYLASVLYMLSVFFLINIWCTVKVVQVLLCVDIKCTGIRKSCRINCPPRTHRRLWKLQKEKKNSLDSCHWSLLVFVWFFGYFWSLCCSWEMFMCVNVGEEIHIPIHILYWFINRHFYKKKKK